MGLQPTRTLSEREMRSLDLRDFLALVQEDIKELDTIQRERRRHDKEEKPPRASRKGRQAAEDAGTGEDEPVEMLSLHLVACCGKSMGAFTSIARVRCPFCGCWHRAGDFPPQKGE